MDLQLPGQPLPPRKTAADPTARSWVLALAVHGGIAALLLGGSLARHAVSPEPAPVFEIVIPKAPATAAHQSAAIEPPEPASETPAESPAPIKPIMKQRPRLQPRTEAPPSESTSVSTDSAPAQAAPAAPAPVAAPAQPPPVQQAAPPYAPVLLEWLGRHRDYPRAARIRRQEGTPRIALTLDSSGRLLGLELKEPSGHDLLDRAALDMARRAAPYPPPQLPPGSDRATFVVPVQFRIEH